jgi:hypothetical protein
VIQRSAVVSRLNVVPVAAQILPNRIRCFDQRNLLLAPPTLEFLFPRDGLVYLWVALKPDEAVAVVALGEAVMLSPLVLEDGRSRFPVTPT